MIMIDVPMPRKSEKIPYYAWDTDKIGYCPEFMPRKAEEDNDQ